VNSFETFQIKMDSSHKAGVGNADKQAVEGTKYNVNTTGGDKLPPLLMFNLMI
jgi:hypothetical protein